MPVGFMFEVPGGTTEMYDAAMLDLDVEGNRPPGLLSHTAGPMEGGWRVIDVWENDESFQTFLATRLGAALAKVNMPEPKLTRLEVHNYIR
jgi:hypothetical protein